MSKLLLWSCVQFERHIKWTWAFNLKYSPFLCVTVHCRLLYSTVYTSAIYCTVSLFNSHTFSLWQNALPLTSGRLQTTGTSSSCDRLVLSRSKGLRVWSFSGHINKKKQDKRHWTDRKPQSNQIPCSVLQYLIVWWRFLDSRHFLQAFFTTKNKQKYSKPNNSIGNKHIPCSVDQLEVASRMTLPHLVVHVLGYCTVIGLPHCWGASRTTGTSHLVLKA